MTTRPPLYLCRHCHHDTGTPPPFSMVVHCKNCLRVTAASVAKAMGDERRRLGSFSEETAPDPVPARPLDNADQRSSDNKFYMSQLFKRLIDKLGMDPDSDTWFDIADKVEQTADALTAMTDAFDIGQVATDTSAIGKARAALGKPQIKEKPNATTQD